MDGDFDRLETEILSLKRGRRAGRTRPHKLVMLLAVIQLAEDGLLKQNRVYFDNDLIHRFERIFPEYQKADDMCQPSPPFFHLGSAPFWNHKVKPGRDEEYRVLKSPGAGTKHIYDNIDYVYLSDYAFRVIQNEHARTRLRSYIAGILESDE